MDPFATYSHISNAQQFWIELDEVLDSANNVDRDEEEETVLGGVNQESQRPLGRKQIAAVLQSFLSLIDGCYDKYLDAQQNQDYLISRVFDSTIFGPYCHAAAAEMIVHLMHKSTSLHVLLVCYEIVLQYGESEPSVFRVLQHRSKEVLHRLTHHVWAGSYAAEAESRLNSHSTDSSHGVATGPIPVGWAGAEWQNKPEDSTSNQNSDPNSISNFTSVANGGIGEGSKASRNRLLQIRLREKSVRLLYEVCRVQKLDPTDLKLIDEKFINHLFDLVEETRYHHDEAFNYQLIKLLVALNEQFMVSTLSAPKSNPLQSNSAPLGLSRPINSVLKVLKGRLNHSNTFGENIIYMLNRASSNDAEDLCMQLLVLKLLYLLFTTDETAHYFYTNDLRVLVDVFIRELSDLPDESESLRHTYLRVLHPLLTNTQLCSYPYKRPQIRRLLMGMTAHGHIKDISPTTKRLVDRCLKAEWCVELDNLDPATGFATVASIGGGETREKPMHQGFTVEGLPYLTSSIDETPTSKATERSIAVAGEDQSSLSSSISTSPVHAFVSPSPALENGISLQALPPPTLTTSAIETLSPDSSRSIPLPRTRDKRVLSLSSPRPPHSAVLAAASQESPGGRRVASTSSARSAPPTPPRRDSTTSTTSVANSEMDGLDSAFSTSSSWHAHMVDTSSNSSSTTTPISVTQARTCSPSYSTSSSSTSHHPYFHHSLSENAQSLPRVGSPLSSDVTPHFFSNTLSSDDLNRTESNGSVASLAINLSNLGLTCKSRNGTNDSNASSFDCYKPISSEDAKPMKPRRRPPPATPPAAASAALQAEASRKAPALSKVKAEEAEEEAGVAVQSRSSSSIKVPSLHVQEASGDQATFELEDETASIPLGNVGLAERNSRNGRRGLDPSFSDPSALSSNPTSRSASPTSSSQMGGSGSGRRRRPPPPPSVASSSVGLAPSGLKAPPPPVNRALKSKSATPRSGTPDGEEKQSFRRSNEGQSNGGLRVG